MIISSNNLVLSVFNSNNVRPEVERKFSCDYTAARPEAGKKKKNLTEKKIIFTLSAEEIR